jgi:hypothetical protein
MNSRSVFLGIFLITAVAAPRSIWAGAAAILPGEREVMLPHICNGGPDHGDSCTVQFMNVHVVTNDCPQGKCEIEFLSGPGTLFDATVTVIADDIPSLQPPASPPAAASYPVTVIADDIPSLQQPQNTRAVLIVEVKKNGKTYVLTEVTQVPIGALAFKHPMGD